MSWKQVGPFCVAAFGMDFANGMFVAALPFLAMAMGAESRELGHLTVVRSAAYVAACLIVPALLGRRGGSYQLVIAVAGVAAAHLATAHVGDLSHLYPVMIWWAVFLSLYWPGLLGRLGEAHSRAVLSRAAGAVNVAWGTGFAVGSFVGGLLYQFGGRLVFMVAPITPAVGCAVLLFARAGRDAPNTVRRTPHPPGLRRRLVSAWLGLMSANLLFGLMAGVFPKLGERLGVTPDIFGALMFVLGLGRLVAFFMGAAGSRWTHGWVGAAISQAAAAVLVATVAWADSHAWLGLVFGVVGLGVGVTYQRSLYASLVEEGPRQRRSGVHEAFLVAGVLLGGLMGGYLAHWIGLRAPYVPAAGLVLVLLVVQAMLASSARKARGGGKREDA